MTRGRSLGLLAAVAGVALLAYHMLVGLPLGSGPEPSGLADPGTGTEDRAALIGDLETIAYDEARAGVTIRKTDAGAAFVFADGREIAVVAPDGWGLTGEFVVLDEIRGGVFVAPESGSGELYVPFVDTGGPREPTNSTQAIALYSQVAEQLRGAGSYAVLADELPVLEVAAAQDAVYFCLDRSAQAASDPHMGGGLRFVGRLLLTVLHPGGCDLTETGPVAEKLALAEALFAVNR